MKSSLLTLLLLAVIAAPAPAAPTLVLPDGTARPQPYQEWVDRIRVPTVGGTISLHVEPCPGAERARACWFNRNIWLRPALYQASMRDELLHELGHGFDEEYMDPWERGTFRAIMGDTSPTPWDCSPGEGAAACASERFANAYAACALNGRRVVRTTAGYRPSRHQHRKACRAIRRFALEAAGTPKASDP